MELTIPRPPYDKELGEALKAFKFPSPILPEHIKLFRSAPTTTVEKVLVEPYKSNSHAEMIVDGPNGPITLSIFTPRTLGPSPVPCIYWMHSGGMITGNRYGGVHDIWDSGLECNAVVVSVEYRLAPENPDPAPLDDCYAGLEWVASRATELGIDSSKIMVAGVSAGGGLAAGITLRSRNLKGPIIYAQCLSCPMLDDRCTSVSSHQYTNEGTWSRISNLTGWKSLLGNRCGSDEVSIYSAAGRADDLRGLPQTFIDVGSAEVFRDEAVGYASALWAAGVQAELHVWPGGFHCFDSLAPHAVLSKIAKETRKAWIRRTFCIKPSEASAAQKPLPFTVTDSG